MSLGVGRRKRASANGIPSSDLTQVKVPNACAHAGAKPSAVAETSKDLMRPWDSRMILAQVGKWWFPFWRIGNQALTV
jgi:hypothetical protein